MSSGETVAILGLGIIGSRVADCVSRAGRETVTWSRSFRGREDEVRSCAEAVAQAGVVCLFLKDGPAVREVMSAVRDCLGPGKVVMNHSTVDLATTKWLEELCLGCGCGFLDAPFTGSKVAAENGQLVYYVGGDSELAAEMDSVLAMSSGRRIACGEVGQATVVKLATNLMSACIVQATAEALALVVQHGVPPQVWKDAVGANANSSALTMMKMPTMLAGDYDPHFSLDNMAKDGRYAAELLQAAGLDSPALDTVLGRMEELVAKGMGGLDYSALAKPYFESP